MSDDVDRVFFRTSAVRELWCERDRVEAGSRSLLDDIVDQVAQLLFARSDVYYPAYPDVVLRKDLTSPSSIRALFFLFNADIWLSFSSAT